MNSKNSALVPEFDPMTVAASITDSAEGAQRYIENVFDSVRGASADLSLGAIDTMRKVTALNLDFVEALIASRSPLGALELTSSHIGNQIQLVGEGLSKWRTASYALTGDLANTFKVDNSLLKFVETNCVFNAILPKSVSVDTVVVKEIPAKKTSKASAKKAGISVVEATVVPAVDATAPLVTAVLETTEPLMQVVEETTAPLLAAIEAAAEEAISQPVAEAVSQPVVEANETSKAHAADDLRRIIGIGPANERKLHEQGVTTFGQIAAWTDVDIEIVEAVLDFDGRIAREKWVEQAQLLANGDEDQFALLFPTAGSASNN